jgi:hypothetical protein
MIPFQAWAVISHSRPDRLQILQNGQMKPEIKTLKNHAQFALVICLILLEQMKYLTLYRRLIRSIHILQ